MAVKDYWKQAQAPKDRSVKPRRRDVVLSRLELLPGEILDQVFKHHFSGFQLHHKPSQALSHLQFIPVPRPLEKDLPSKIEWSPGQGPISLPLTSSTIYHRTISKMQEHVTRTLRLPSPHLHHELLALTFRLRQRHALADRIQYTSMDSSDLQDLIRASAMQLMKNLKGVVLQHRHLLRNNGGRFRKVSPPAGSIQALFITLTSCSRDSGAIESESDFSTTAFNDPTNFVKTILSNTQFTFNLGPALWSDFQWYEMRIHIRIKHMIELGTVCLTLVLPGSGTCGGGRTSGMVDRLGGQFWQKWAQNERNNVQCVCLTFQDVEVVRVRGLRDLMQAQWEDRRVSDQTMEV